MKKSKLWLFFSFFFAAVLVLTACGDNDTGTGGTATTDNNEPAATQAPVTEAEQVDVEELDEIYTDANGNYRFTETREISVALWNRTDGIEAPDTYWAHWIQDQMYELHNVRVVFEHTPRWGEDEFQSTNISAGTAPDIGYTFNSGMVQTMAGMMVDGQPGMINLAPYLQRYRGMLPNLFDQVTENNLFHSQNRETGELFWMTGRRASEGIQHTATFIREDWLAALDLPIPNTLEEFENTLLAFRDRADELPGVGETGRVRVDFPEPEGGWGDTPNEEGYRFEFVYHDLNAEDIIPYLLGNDVGWWAMGLFDSFIDNDISEREWYVRGFDDRRFMHEDAIREGTRVLNRWFNEGLLWDDFVLAEAAMADDLIRLGRVGAFHHTWDQPFRPGGNGWTTVMRENIGESANYIVINPFENNAGVNRKFASLPTDRAVFFPHTNTEVLASLLYLDFMNRPATLDFLQFGFEGVHHDVTDSGAFETLAADGWPANQMFSGPRNFDINPLINGVWFDLVDQDRALATAALGYPGIAPEVIMNAFDLAFNNSQVFRHVSTRTIDAQDGMQLPLNDMRNQIWHNLIASPSVNQDNFDTQFDAQYMNYMMTGGQAILDEREAAWIESFGDVDTMPDVEVE